MTVEVDPVTGTFSLDGTAGLGRLVDDGDSGDTYNYSPPRKDHVVDQPSTVAVRVAERGPLRARVVIDRTYVWPESVFFGERSGRARGADDHDDRDPRRQPDRPRHHRARQPVS